MNYYFLQVSYNNRVDRQDRVTRINESKFVQADSLEEAKEKVMRKIGDSRLTDREFYIVDLTIR